VTGGNCSGVSRRRFIQREKANDWVAGTARLPYSNPGDVLSRGSAGASPYRNSTAAVIPSKSKSALLR
jgi:hypothetical protein